VSVSTKASAYYSVGQIAEERGVANTTVLAWIRSGELPAELNSRSRSSKRPHYIISAKAYDEFKAKRATVPFTAPARMQRQPPTRTDAHAEAVQFFAATKPKPTKGKAIKKRK
jgi:hypothetical protein